MFALLSLLGLALAGSALIGPMLSSEEGDDADTSTDPHDTDAEEASMGNLLEDYDPVTAHAPLLPDTPIAPDAPLQPDAVLQPDAPTEAQTQLVPHATPLSDALAELKGDTPLDPIGLLQGSAGSDVLTGAQADDIIEGNSGNDYINGFAGNDQLLGGTGADQMHGDAGDDTLYGDDGDDTVQGYIGHDRLFGGAGNDTVHGGDGDDLLDGGYDDDQLLGGGGDDVLVGGAGRDMIQGSEGNDLLDGVTGEETGAEQDFLNGSEGDDILIGNDTDVMSGGEGADRFEITGGTVEIMDYEDSDTIVLNYTGDLPTLTTEVSDMGITLLADGLPVASLYGVTSFDVGTVQLMAE